jgi:hypothetical protein
MAELGAARLATTRGLASRLPADLEIEANPVRFELEARWPRGQRAFRVLGFCVKLAAQQRESAMPDQQSTGRRAAAEAKAWFRKLSTIPVSNADIWAYAAWCREPGNRAAYNRVEARARAVPADGLFTEAEILAALKRRPDLARAYRARFKRQERPAGLADIARELAIRVGLP